MPSAPPVHNVGQQISRTAPAGPKPALRMRQVHSEISSVAPLKEHVHPAHVTRLHPPFNRKSTVGPHVQTRRGRDHQVPVRSVKVEGLAHFSTVIAHST